jgi:hypothetical protein
MTINADLVIACDGNSPSWQKESRTLPAFRGERAGDKDDLGPAMLGERAHALVWSTMGVRDYCPECAGTVPVVARPV